MQPSDRKDSFCNYTIGQNRMLVVEDLDRDSRFTGNPYLSAPYNFRFYDGAPLHSPNGYPVGTVGLLDQRPRQLPARQRRLLERAASFS